MFENLSERLERSFKILKGEGKITEINVAETLKDVRRALLDANLPEKVVLPEPCNPDMRIIDGFCDRFTSAVSPPIKVASSSCTIFTINLPTR